MSSENYKQLRSFLGTIGSIEVKDSVLTEFRYMLKYRLGLDISNITYNDDNVYKINTEELLKSDRIEVQILSLMISAIDKCDKTLRSEKLFFNLTSDIEKDIVASKCLYLLIKTFLQAYFEGELDKCFEDTKNLTHIFMTHNKDSSKWLDDAWELESSSFSPHYRRFKKSIFFEFFNSGKANKSKLDIIPILVRFQRSIFFNPKPLIPRKPKVEYSPEGYKNSDLQQLIENKMRSERTDEKEDVVITSHDIKKYCKTWNEQSLAQCGNNYQIYMEWFLKRYSEVNMDEFKKKCQNRYHDCVNDYICERFFHFSFINKLLTSSLPLERVENPELFMPLVMTENPYVIDIYFNLLTRSYEEEKVLRFDSSVPVNTSFNSHIENISKFVDYMNRVYNPALYYNFLGMLNKHGIKLSDVNTLFDCLDTIGEGQEIQSAKTDSKVKDLLGRMRNIKNLLNIADLTIPNPL